MHKMSLCIREVKGYTAQVHTHATACHQLCYKANECRNMVRILLLGAVTITGLPFSVLNK